jgi:phage gpG-like protein
MKPEDFARNLQAAITKTLNALPRKVGVEAVAFYRQSFRQQGYTDFYFSKWKARKDKGRGSKGRAILSKSGDLRRSIRIVRSGRGYVVVGTDLPYAAVHNLGFRGQVSVPGYTRHSYDKVKVGTGRYSIKTRKENTRSEKRLRAGSETPVKAHTKNMNIPKRQFMGSSIHLNKKIQTIVAYELKKALGVR